MEQIWFVARSVTYAQRMEKTLARAGIRSRIFHAPRDLSNRGCAYIVEIPGGAVTLALTILGEAGLYPDRLYRFQRGGYQEIPLP